MSEALYLMTAPTRETDDAIDEFPKDAEVLAQQIGTAGNKTSHLRVRRERGDTNLLSVLMS